MIKKILFLLKNKTNKINEKIFFEMIKKIQNNYFKLNLLKNNLYIIIETILNNYNILIT
jgi:hypothetical protein